MLGCTVQAHAAVQALLIGIGAYAESNLADLAGPANDVALMKGVLIHLQVPEANIRVLPNPTHSTIETAFADLSTRVERNDQVYVYYAGHGSRAPAPPPANGEDAERRGEDQTWVAFGARSPLRDGKDKMDVRDEEIALWRDPLYELTPDVVVASISCHSASVTRDAQVGVRAADGLLQPHPLRASIQRVEQPTTGLPIGAARDFESAVELDPRNNQRCPDGRNCYGVVTWHRASALRSARPDESWGDVFHRASAAIAATRGVAQRPQMDGVADRAVLGGQFAPLTALIPVTSVGQGGQVRLGAGLISGWTVGSEFAGAGSSPLPAPRVCWAQRPWPTHGPTRSPLLRLRLRLRLRLHSPPIPGCSSVRRIRTGWKRAQRHCARHRSG